MIKQKIKDLIANLKQRFCFHNGAYTQLEHNLNENRRRIVRKCDECGFGKENFAKTEEFLLQRNLSTNNN